MSWIQTFTGKQFSPLAPDPAAVCIEDIAHALALKCRFTGHCNEFYSVAQHSVIVSHIVPPQDALWGLMHDGAEAYLPDVARPIKGRACFDVGTSYPVLFSVVESAVMATIAEAFDLVSLVGVEPPSVKAADLVALATEARDLLKPPPIPWELTKHIRPLDGRIIPLGPVQAETLFRDRFDELMDIAGAAASAQTRR